MSKRLTSITTGSGDSGTTSIVGPERLAKDAERIEAIGTVDELNAQIGLCLAELAVDSPLTGRLVAVQHDLFDLGGELAMPGTQMLTPAHHERLLAWQQDMNQSLPELENFLLPGGSRSVALLQLARAVARRAERRLVSLHNRETLNPDALIYLNRLSDLLFVAGRWQARSLDEAEQLWQQNIHQQQQ